MAIERTDTPPEPDHADATEPGHAESADRVLDDKTGDLDSGNDGSRVRESEPAHRASDDRTGDRPSHRPGSDDMPRWKQAVLSAAVLAKLAGGGGLDDAAANLDRGPAAVAASETSRDERPTDGPVHGAHEPDRHRGTPGEQEDEDPNDAIEKIRSDIRAATGDDDSGRRPTGRPADDRPRQDPRSRVPTPYRRNKGPR
jgi:hypothetical protein